MITLVDYNAGNITSVRRALDHIGIPCQITASPDVVRRAEKIIFPGVGAAGAAMQVLHERGLDEALREAFARGTPMMGICLGAQVVLTRSEEGKTSCLDLLPGNCPRFALSDPNLKIPHMGWNAVTVIQPHFILKDLQPGDEFYYVHSFYPQPANSGHIFAVSEYELTFPAAIGDKNLFATQFHPEKSGPIGLNVLNNYTIWEP